MLRQRKKRIKFYPPNENDDGDDDRTFSKLEVYIPRIRVGIMKTIKNLIIEETLLFADYLRNREKMESENSIRGVC